MAETVFLCLFPLVPDPAALLWFDAFSVLHPRSPAALRCIDPKPTIFQFWGFSTFFILAILWSMVSAVEVHPDAESEHFKVRAFCDDVLYSVERVHELEVLSRGQRWWRIWSLDATDCWLVVRCKEWPGRMEWADTGWLSVERTRWYQRSGDCPLHSDALWTVQWAGPKVLCRERSNGSAVGAQCRRPRRWTDVDRDYDLFTVRKWGRGSYWISPS